MFDLPPRSIVARTKVGADAAQDVQTPQEKEAARDERDRWAFALTVAGFGITVLTFVASRK